MQLCKHCTNVVHGARYHYRAIGSVNDFDSVCVDNANSVFVNVLYVSTSILSFTVLTFFHCFLYLFLTCRIMEQIILKESFKYVNLTLSFIFNSVRCHYISLQKNSMKVLKYKINGIKMCTYLMLKTIFVD